jgi:hypothetical protein
MPALIQTAPLDAILFNLSEDAPDVHKAAQTLLDAVKQVNGNSQQLSPAAEDVVRLLYEYHFSKQGLYTKGMIKGFEAAWILLKSCPKKGTLEAKIWEHWKDNPSLKNKLLCSMLDKSVLLVKLMPKQAEKDIQKAIDAEQRRPLKWGEKVRKSIIPTYTTALLYSHAFEKFLSDERMAFDKWMAAERFYRKVIIKARKHKS